MPQIAKVGIDIDARSAQRVLKDILDRGKKLTEVFDKNSRSSRNLQAAIARMERAGIRGLRDLEDQARKTGNSFRTIGTAVKAAGVAFASYKAIQVGISRVESERRLKLVAAGYGEVALLQAEATASAKKFNLSQTEANEALANAYARLRPLGISLEEIKSTFNGFNTAAKLGGATSQEAAASFTQLSQALGSGALRGDEFRSIAEQAPLVLKAISDETGVAAGALKDYAQEGLLTSDIVIKALKRIETEGADKLKEALGGPAAAIKEFQNAVEDVASEVTRTVVPQLSTAFRDIAQIIRDLEGPISFIGGLIGGLLSGVAKLTTRLRRGAAGVEAEQQAADAARRQTTIFERFGPDSKFQQIYKKELARRLAIVDGAVPGQLPPSAAILPGAGPISAGPTSTLPSLVKTKKGGKGGRGRAPAKERADISQRLLDLNKELFAQTEAGNELEIAALELMIKKQEIAEGNFQAREKELKLAQALHKFRLDNQKIDQREIDDRERALKLLQEEETRRQEMMQRQLEADPGYQMKQQLEELVKLENQVAAGAQAIGSAFANSFRSLITGAKSGEQALADMMASIGEHFLDMAAQIIAQQTAMIIYGTIMKALGVSMPGGGGGFGGPGLGIADPSGFDLNATGAFKPFAEGGFVTGPTHALIGEGSQPEYVIPESKMGEAMSRYNAGARGSSVIPGKGGGDSAAGTPGGGAIINYNGPTLNFNSEDYVPTSAVAGIIDEATKRGAKAGEARTFATLRNSRSQRSRIGMGR